MKKTAARQVVTACKKLLSGEDEASGTSRAQQTLALYAVLDAPHRLQWFAAFKREFAPHPARVKAAAPADAHEPSSINLEALRKDAELKQVDADFRYLLPSWFNPEYLQMVRVDFISNCQPGLRGVSRGNFLIKQVVAQLSQEFPRVDVSGALRGNRVRKDVSRRSNQQAVVWQPHQPI